MESNYNLYLSKYEVNRYSFLYDYLWSIIGRILISCFIIYSCFGFYNNEAILSNPNLLIFVIIITLPILFYSLFSITYYININIIYKLEFQENEELLNIQYTNMKSILTKTFQLNIPYKKYEILEKSYTAPQSMPVKRIYIQYNYKTKYVIDDTKISKEKFNLIRQELRKYASNKVKDGWTD